METKVALKEIEKMAPHILKLGEKHIWFDYDNTADVLYVSLEKPQKATDSEMIDGNTILRYRRKKLVGVTLLNAKNS